jgi:hypothetical protein
MISAGLASWMGDILMLAPKNKNRLEAALAAGILGLALLAVSAPAEAQMRGFRGGPGFHQGFGGGPSGFRGFGGGIQRPFMTRAQFGGVNRPFGGFHRGFSGGVQRPFVTGARFGSVHRPFGGVHRGFVHRPFVHRTAFFPRRFHHRRRFGGGFATGFFTGAALGFSPAFYGYPYAGYGYPYYTTASYDEECFVVRRRVRDPWGRIVIRRRIVCA